MRMRNFASMEIATSKRRRSVLTSEIETEIMRKMEEGKSQGHVAGILKDREKISCHVFGAEDTTVAKLRCIVRGSQFPSLDDTL